MPSEIVCLCFIKLWLFLIKSVFTCLVFTIPVLVPVFALLLNHAMKVPSHERICHSKSSYYVPTKTSLTPRLFFSTDHSYFATFLSWLDPFLFWLNGSILCYDNHLLHYKINRSGFRFKILWLTDGGSFRTHACDSVLEIKQIKSFIMLALLCRSVKRVCGLNPRVIAPGQHSSFRRNVAVVSSRWQRCIRFDRPDIWTSDLPLQRRTRYHSTNWPIWNRADCLKCRLPHGYSLAFDSLL